MQAALSVPFVARLASPHGDRAALVTPDGHGDLRRLADRVADVADRLGPTRRLVLVAGANDVDAVVAYLAALAAGHPVILVPGDNPANLDAVAGAYDPDVVHDGRPGRAAPRHRPRAAPRPRAAAVHVRVHRVPEAGPALPRQRRGQRGRDRELPRDPAHDVAATTLPMHYCYGLSVINSHLLAGATLLLTDLSVVDACFWERFRAHRATTFAGVPYTFDLLDRVGFADMDLPSLRYVTQAGGRLAPERVRRYAEPGRRRGWDLFVMYGQTEATARMAYLPPDLAAVVPVRDRRPIPGGSFSLEPLPEARSPATVTSTSASSSTTGPT